ncbi:hypothetical protein Ahy_B05g075372 [Arachis hypogaea]|uniref:Pentatricopeptide repeat-containing protein n=1 Tax=Arachis hypogaea TaxID=3818 RepID=A0A444Z119_ARAHY|nr:hypothetical protein Ahy_B05g075372 [Arachis hypogaea]
MESTLRLDAFHFTILLLSFDCKKRMLSLVSSSPIKLRYAFQFPNSVPHSALRLFFHSTSSLHSPSQSQSLDEAVDSFTRMLSMRPPPSIIQFTKILGSLAKANHFPTAISLFQQLQAS